MSLYNDIANTIAKKGIVGALGGSISSAVGGVGGGINDALGGTQVGDRLVGIGAGMAGSAATGLVNKYIPSNIQGLIRGGSGAVGELLNGNLDNAALKLLDSGLLGKIFPGVGGLLSQARYLGTPTPLFGGISPAEAMTIYNEMRGEKLCRKNLWLIEVSSNLWGDMSKPFNMFATEIEYSPYTVTGEKKRIGAAHVDLVNSADPIELSITTMDDQFGFIKGWFAIHAAATASHDGTVGVPDDYAIKIKIVHGFITQESNWGGYEDIGKYRAANIDMSLSRREDGLEELRLNFVQLDTFM